MGEKTDKRRGRGGGWVGGWVRRHTQFDVVVESIDFC